ncbi:MAG: 2-amino-4-hydroxy-6-hydroxymethyldihydropteridine diphosphokinase [Methylococcales bacterium]|nr:2-amino-4-hydroxy-6-hydroxymethyldihydropteridine diphosphokinase [Methylococcales bacterium]MBT7443046.1 2-amino-4-hydroxy-6-hydroxymethyldihydropteridine diphosphokinase [Methylococcales bacterium]
MTELQTAYVSLGSNLGDSKAHIAFAIEALRGLSEPGSFHVSQLYQTKPIGPGEQDDYINAAVCLLTKLTPVQLLTELHKIERARLRERKIHWGARTLDLDLLLVEAQEMQSEFLILPHPRIFERAFVLMPLADLAEELVIPGQGKLTELLASCDRSGVSLMSA